MSDDYPTREDLLANIRGNPHLTQTQQRAAVAALRDKCTCPTLEGFKVTGSSCPLHGLPDADWEDVANHGSGGVPPGLGGPPAHPPPEPKTFYEHGVT